MVYGILTKIQMKKKVLIFCVNETCERNYEKSRKSSDSLPNAAGGLGETENPPKNFAYFPLKMP